MSEPLEVSVQDVQELRARNDHFLLLDCREDVEYQTAAIEGAKLIPMGQLSDRVSELEPYRAERIVVHCHHGARSLRVAMALRQTGFDHVQSMAGGIDAWSLEIDPNIPRY